MRSEGNTESKLPKEKAEEEDEKVEGVGREKVPKENEEEEEEGEEDELCG